ncbi:polyprenyl synthetase family protein [Aureitalea marina]|uniref:Polyprenyl synthetase n=1 Tax=Aureitalea marina TaxID=930804 RepID=A0A2S7KRF5_9FLAO|nr:polyprenyl synthetase family protein [Aureitalea marina]PQB05209.1 polyprenyl synthetase [Aureitalea marina]
MESLNTYRTQLETYLDKQVEKEEPQQLYDPIRYILSLGGKRLRPTLTLMAAEIFGSKSQKAIPAALAVELFHNFSLIHDDIMDEAPLRRGKETVHQKWDLNTGILSGDAMLILAYQLFEQYEPALFRDLAVLFSQTAIEVCEGQQYDMDFETRDDVSIPEYLRMIEFKTAVLVGASLKMGALVAGATEESANSIYHFGRLLGLAFQLQDDYLDAFGDPEKFGKQVGGDIISNKKTYLYLKALELSAPADGESLRQLYSVQPADPSEKVDTVMDLFVQSGADKAIQKAVEYFTIKANEELDNIDLSDQAKQQFRDFGLWLMNRST